MGWSALKANVLCDYQGRKNKMLLLQRAKKVYSKNLSPGH